ncbi:hypothetical protein MVEN_00684300 [Mycena venus]|uniref:Uncharacterized protein n=1 Tax=Mycena venus TaxID=2733690 RepID=A0A8H7D2Z3_9AGAR|nr:hypothetical protein MVEN_00684300 [Mycena venus]
MPVHPTDTQNIETAKRNKRTYTGGILPPSVLNHIGKFTETLHKIHTFVESQQGGSKVKQFFHQGEMNTLLKDCKNGLTQGLEFFQLKNTGIITASTMRRTYSLSHNSSKSISMLPSEPKIFHGRESELPGTDYYYAWS